MSLRIIRRIQIDLIIVVVTCGFVGCTNMQTELDPKFQVRCPTEFVKGECAEIPLEWDDNDVIEIDSEIKRWLLDTELKHCISIVIEWRLRYDECRNTMNQIFDKLEASGIIRMENENENETPQEPKSIGD